MIYRFRADCTLEAPNVVAAITYVSLYLSRLAGHKVAVRMGLAPDGTIESPFTSGGVTVEGVAEQAQARIQ